MKNNTPVLSRFRVPVLFVLCACGLALTGCMADGNGGVFMGVHAYADNVETTVGKVNRDQMSPTRSPEKNYRTFNHSAGSASTSTSTGSFQRQGGGN